MPEGRKWRPYESSDPDTSPMFGGANVSKAYTHQSKFKKLCTLQHLRLSLRPNT